MQLSGMTANSGGEGGSGSADYAAQFRAIGSNFVQTVLYIDDISLQDVLAALPAVIYMGVLLSLLTVTIVRAYWTHWRQARKVILQESLNMRTSILFQKLVQPKSIMKYFMRETVLEQGETELMLIEFDELMRSLVPDSQECSADCVLGIAGWKREVCSTSTRHGGGLDTRSRLLGWSMKTLLESCSCLWMTTAQINWISSKCSSSLA